MNKFTLLGALVLAVGIIPSLPASAGDGSITLIHMGDLHGQDRKSTRLNSSHQ